MATVEDEREHARQADLDELELVEFAETAYDGGITAAQMNELRFLAQQVILAVEARKAAARR